ncbi:MAG TPA: RepB family DNA primase [Bryobacteraceae bacterium]|nr:RepB family DNA primase [Bryobacteraceae bacterium]
MIPRTWDAESLIRSIPWMKLQNLQGRNIYVRPKGEHNLSLVDDLKHDAVNRMAAAGFNPAVLVETSTGNFQAWLKHPKMLSKEISTAAARTLADQFGGDKGAADWRHFGRLAGFTNRKLKYQSVEGLFPFVRLIAASGSGYPAADRFLAQVESKLEQERLQRDLQRASRGKQQPPSTLRTIDQFRLNPFYGGDGTRIDLAYAIYALSHGRSEADVEAALRGRDLSHKGNEKRQSEYIERTIKKAFAVTMRTEWALTR